jgi:ABC-type dipeptide/oligopeptide/nickel transport system permease component
VLKYTFYRVMQLIPVWILLSIVVFAIVHALPGDAIDALVPADAASNPATRAALEKELGLDKPIYIQYLKWLERIVLHGDFGKSITTRRTISVEIFNRLPATIYLAVTAVLVSLVIAIPLGTIAAVKRRTPVDYAATATALLGVSVPEFWLAILCILFFSLYLGWLPASEYRSPFDHFGLSLMYLALPAGSLGVRLAAITTRLTRSSMLDEVRKEYVDTARSLGLPERRVIYKYTLRNALIPTVTVAGLQFARLLGGTVVVESIFSWPGVGLVLYEAILGRDYPMIQAAILILATAFVLMNLLVDLIYRWLNPRIRLG